MTHELNKFIRDQLSVWPLASANFRTLKGLKSRGMEVGGLPCRIQYNPVRVLSSTADTSPEAIAARKCFLCKENRPAEQFHLKFEGRKGRLYNIQVNPYPIFPKHLVILCVPLFPSLFGEERSETHVDENTGDTPSLNETDVREILFRKFGSEFPEHPPVRLKKKRFGIDKNAVIVKKNGFQHVPLLSSSTFPVNSLRYSSGEVRYFSRNRREK